MNGSLEPKSAQHSSKKVSINRPRASTLLDLNSRTKVESIRQWNFGFNEYYDVYIWSLEAGQPWAYMYNLIQGVRNPESAHSHLFVNAARCFSKHIASARSRICTTLRPQFFER